MTQPPVPGSSPEATDLGQDGVLAGTAPHLFAMPLPEGGPPTVAWPGAEGQPTWAIPVTIPAGTRGYAVFIPLLPVQPAATTIGVGTTPPAAGANPTSAAGRAAADRTSATGHAAASSTPAAQAADATPAAEVAGTTPAAQAAGTTPAAADAGPARSAPHPAAPPGEAAGQGGPAVPGSQALSTPVGAGPTVGGAPNPRIPAETAATLPAPPVHGHAGAPAPITAAVPAQAQGTRPWHAPDRGPAQQAGGPPYRPFQPSPPRPSFFDRHWPGPKPATGRAVPAAVLAGALGLAFFVPLSRTGIGWFLGWLTLTVGVVVAVRRHTAELPRAERWVRAGWAVAALALLSVLTFRNAWWLVTFCVLGALGCATLAIVGGRLVRSILFGLVATPVAAFRGLPWVRGHLRAPADPGLARRIAGSAAATVAALIVFGALLSSADGAFSVVLGAIVPEVSVGTVFRWVFLGAVGGLCAVAAVWTLSAPPDLSTVDKPTGRSLGAVEWAPVITALTLLFGGFVAVQFTVLFGGQRHVLRTAGLSYAEYARSGFWQLVVVTMLTLAVLGGVARWARRDRPVERVLLRVLLGALSALSFVIVVSALSRMYTYQKVYSFTGERLFVMAFELLLGTVFLMILLAGLRWRGGWIPRATVALAVLMLLGLAALNPEAYAARRNIARYEQTGKIDAWYLRALSADATPALAGLPDPVRRCTLSWVAKDLAEPDPWYAWNLGRARAREALDRVGNGAVGGRRDCKAADQYDLPKTRR